MLTENFKTANKLGIDSKVHEGLRKVLKRLEINDLVHIKRPDEWVRMKLPFHGFAGVTEPNGFNMSVVWEKPCGTVGCLAGWTAVEAGLDQYSVADISELTKLFYPEYWFENHPNPKFQKYGLHYNDITPAEAAQALRYYLTTGEIDWSHLMK